MSKPHIKRSNDKWLVFWRQPVVKPESGMLNHMAYHLEFERICQQAKVWWQMREQYDIIDGIPVRYKQ